MLVVTVGVLVVLAAVDVAITVVALVARPPSAGDLAWVVGEVLLVAVLLVLVTRPRMRVLWPDPAEQSLAEQAWSRRRAERAGMPWWRRIRQALIDDRTARGGTRPGR